MSSFAKGSSRQQYHHQVSQYIYIIYVLLVSGDLSVGDSVKLGRVLVAVDAVSELSGRKIGCVSCRGKHLSSSPSSSSSLETGHYYYYYLLLLLVLVLLVDRFVHGGCNYVGDRVGRPLSRRRKNGSRVRQLSTYLLLA